MTEKEYYETMADESPLEMVQDSGFAKYGPQCNNRYGGILLRGSQIKLLVIWYHIQNNMP